MPAGEAEEAAALVRSEPSPVEERVEKRIVMRGHGAADRFVDEAERVVVMAAAFDQRAHIPFEIGRRGGAVLHVEEMAIAAGRDHENALVAHRS